MTSTSYRGYVIRPVFGAGPQLYFEHGSVEHPGDRRFGYGETEQDCRDQIDDQIADRMAQVARAGAARMGEGL